MGLTAVGYLPLWLRGGEGEEGEDDWSAWSMYGLWVQHLSVTNNDFNLLPWPLTLFLFSLQTVCFLPLHVQGLGLSRSLLAKIIFFLDLRKDKCRERDRRWEKKDDLTKSR